MLFICEFIKNSKIYLIHSEAEDQIFFNNKTNYEYNIYKEIIPSDLLNNDQELQIISTNIKWEIFQNCEINEEIYIYIINNKKFYKNNLKKLPESVKNLLGINENFLIKKNLIVMYKVNFYKLHISFINNVCKFDILLKIIE